MASIGALAGVGIGATVLGGITSAIGAGTSAAASASAFSYKAGIAQLNAQVDKQNAAWALNSGGVKAANEGLKSGQAIAQTKVVQARSGFDVNSGSNEAVRETQTDVARKDQDTILADSAHTAYGYETKAAADTAEANLDEASAKNAKTSGVLGILSSIIGAGASVAGKWTQGNTIGIGTGPIGTFADGGNSGAPPAWSY